MLRPGHGRRAGFSHTKAMPAREIAHQLDVNLMLLAGAGHDQGVMGIGNRIVFGLDQKKGGDVDDT